MNESTEVFLTRIRNINLNRIAQAEAGNYTDIDPDDDVMAQMEDHLMYVTGIVGYNNRTYTKYRTTNGSAMVGSGELERMISDAYIEDDYATFILKILDGAFEKGFFTTKVELREFLSEKGLINNNSLPNFLEGTEYYYIDEAGILRRRR